MPLSPSTTRVADRILKRTYLVVAGFVLVALGIMGQTLRIQQKPPGAYAQQQSENRLYKKTVLADRGSILAENNAVLAATLPFYRFAMDPTVLRERDYENLSDSLVALSQALAREFGRDSVQTPAHFLRKILRARESDDRHIYLFPVQRRFTYQDYERIRQMPVLRRGRFEGGLIVEKVNNKRFYPLDKLGKITLGQLVNDTLPTRGIEYAFNQYLRGQHGEMLVQNVGGGVEVPLDYYHEKAAEHGADVVTTLDVNLQDATDNALRSAIAKHDAKSGVAILMETSTGDIKAMANYPETYNKAVATRYEPGSTFKLASVIALLEDGVMSPSDSINTGKHGYMQYYDRTMYDEAAYGTLTLRQAVEKSSNVAISKVIFNHYRRQPKQFLKRLEQMGVLSPSGVQLKGEPKPYVIRPENTIWNGTTLPWLSTGYNVRLTPLQLLSFYNGIANDGHIVKPRLVKAIRRGAEVTRRFEIRENPKPICSTRTLLQVQTMLEGVVKNGTAANIRNDRYAIAGKTGTAQKLIDGEYQEKYRASFVGYFPADHPRYSCLVMIDEPSGEEYYGSHVAAPVFREIADAVYANTLRQQRRSPPRQAEAAAPEAELIPRQLAERVYAQLNVPTPEAAETPYVRPVAKNDHVRYREQELRPNRVPDVRGMSGRSALSLLENLGLRVYLRGTGRVRKQSLEPGQSFRPGELVFLTLNADAS